MCEAKARKLLILLYFREEDEIFNIWTAYLNLEGNFGTNESLKAVFDNAVRNTDALKMYKQMVKIYQKLEKMQVCLMRMYRMFKGLVVYILSLKNRRCCCFGKAEAFYTFFCRISRKLQNNDYFKKFFVWKI